MFDGLKAGNTSLLPFYLPPRLPSRALFAGRSYSARDEEAEIYPISCLTSLLPRNVGLKAISENIWIVPCSQGPKWDTQLNIIHLFYIIIFSVRETGGPKENEWRT